MKHLTVAFLALAVLAGPVAASAADAKATDSKTTESKTKAKPYTLKTCIVSGDELGGMGEAYTFVHEGREIKLCCKGCLKDFKKDSAKFVKKIEEAEAKAKEAKDKKVKG